MLSKHCLDAFKTGPAVFATEAQQFLDALKQSLFESFQHRACLDAFKTEPAAFALAFETTATHFLHTCLSHSANNALSKLQAQHVWVELMVVTPVTHHTTRQLSRTTQQDNCHAPHNKITVTHHTTRRL